MPLPRLVAVVGAGNMGAGLAQKIAMEGFDVLLADMDLDRATRGKETIAAGLKQAVERRVLREPAAQATLDRVTPVGDLADLADADLVIEAIFENLLAKKELFRKLDDVCKEGCVLATNTSSFYVHELASVTRRQGHVIGLHYFFHPAKNRLLEVIPGPLTRPEVTADMDAFAEAHGKTGIRTKDAPGFAVNRFFVPWLNEAVRLLEEGVGNISSIEAAAKKAFRLPMGPFQLMNITGIPIGRHAAATLGTELGPFYEPADALCAQADSGELWSLDGEADDSVADMVRERLLGVVFLIAGALVDEDVCTLEDVDRGARIGLRWARGPFEMMNKVGVAEAHRLCVALAERYDDLSVPACIAARAETGEAFAFRRVDLSIDGDVATIRINRPEVLNALDPEVVGQLDARFDEALGDDRVKAIVLAGAGKAFVAGADISFFVRHIEANDIPGIVQFTEAGQALLRKIEEAPVPVVARVHGMALGGGVELALACHAIVCADKASFTLPETGIGIYPGLGGTQRLPRIVGPLLARRMVLAGQRLKAADAVAAGLALDVVPLTELDRAIARHLAAGLPDRYAREAAAVPAWGEKDEARVAQKAPIAVQVASRLIDEGADRPLSEGLQLELDELPRIFSTKDALIGLKSVGGRNVPEWTGT